ncbi:MAG TPA: lactate racemase domain-containing protein, partial [Pyrinomonadaceae bacterium]
MSTEVLPSTLIGRGSVGLELSSAELQEIVEQALDAVGSGERVLAIIPDKTRDDNTDTLFPFAAHTLVGKGVSVFDVLVAQGTHPPMTHEQKLLKIGEHDFTGRLFDHRWDREDELIMLGELTAQKVNELTGGLIVGPVPVRLNKLLRPGAYDTVLVF